VLHIFNSLSNNDIRFQSVDVSSPLNDAPENASSLERSSAAEASAEGKKSRMLEMYKWHQLVERERDHQGLWREKLYQTLFSDVADDSATLKLPQIWAVTENGLDGLPDSALRVPICKVLACTEGFYSTTYVICLFLIDTLFSRTMLIFWSMKNLLKRERKKNLATLFGMPSLQRFISIQSSPLLATPPGHL
jgi:hypothetical protein